MKFSIAPNVKETKLKPTIGKPYISKIQSAGWHPEYKAGEAYLIKSELYDDDGKKFTWEETFFAPKNSRRVPARTDAFLKYLNALGIDCFEDLIGLEETVVLRKVVSGNRAMLSIVERSCGDIALKDFEHDE